MDIKVRFFALYRERTGRSNIRLILTQGATVRNALEQLRLMFPHLAPPNVNILVAVNATYVSPDHTLDDGDEVALIPPVSGGAL